MAREYAIPSTSTFIQDFGLNVTPQPVLKNRRVVIFGSAEDGPMYEPVLVDKPEDSEIVWGRSTQGELVRGIFECWNVQEGNPNVVGVRIGNGVKATIEILESDSYGTNEEQADNSGAGVTSLKLEARFPGARYNQITIKYDDRRNVAIYNPKTGLTSVFSIDTANPNNSSVDAHNVAELVDAINADRNLNSILRASTSGVLTDFEVKVRSSTYGINQNANGIKIDLKKLMQVSGVLADATDAYLVPDPTLPYAEMDMDAGGLALKNLTITNNLVQIEEIESVSNSEWERIGFNGNIGTFAYSVLDGKGTSRWDTIQALKDYPTADSQFMHDPSGNVVDEYIYSVENVLINQIPTDPQGLDQSGIFTLSVPLPLDDYEEPWGTSVAINWLDSQPSYINYFYAPLSGNVYATSAFGIDTKTVNGVAMRPSGFIRIHVSDDVDPNGSWTELPYNSNSGVYMSEFTAATATAAAFCTFSIGADAHFANSGGYENIYFSRTGDLRDNVKFTNMAHLVDPSGFIRQNKYLRVTGTSVKGFLTEVENLAQLEANISNNFTHYFVRGQEILTNAPPAYPIIANYGTRITYEPDTNVAISDAVNGEITFTNPDLLPGPGGNALTTDRDSNIRFRYTYLPNFPLITSAVQSLKSGTNGTKLNVKQREDELKKAYDYLRDFDATLWVPMDAYVDAIKQDWNQQTGLKEDISNSFAIDIEEFLEELSINSIQPHAILGVSPVPGDTIGERDKWVENLTVVDINDPTRAANVMASIQSKFMSVVAMEPVFLNLGRGQPYANNGQAAYAGLLAGLPYDISPTNKALPGIAAIRKSFSTRQYEQLNAMRYVAMRTRRGQNPVVVNDVTAAPYGSDFVAWGTYSITAEAADRVKRVAETYLGQPNSIELRNAMDQDISNDLQAMSGLQAFNFTISSTIEQQVLGVVEIELILVTIFTMKKIRTTVKLRKSLPVSG
jgi:hypothetical protein